VADEPVLVPAEEPAMSQVSFSSSRFAPGRVPGALAFGMGSAVENRRRPERRIELEAYLDTRPRRMSSQAPGIANVVEASLLFRHNLQYELRAWVIMPNQCASALSCAGRADVAVDGCVERLHGQAGESDIEMQRTILAGRLIGILICGMARTS